VLQWLRGGVAIDGATTSTYKLVEADTGAAITLRASYTDYQGFVEAPVSAATAAVIGQVAATGAPVISDTTPTEGQTLVLDTASIADANGLGAFALKWQASSDGQTWQDIAGQTTAAYSPQDALFASFARGAAVQLRAVASFTDGAGNAETVASAATAAVLAVNDGTAAVTIAGAATVGQTLSASLTADPDGNGTTPQYQWLRNGLAIDGATAATYVLAAADGNQQISVRASYTDHQGFAESPVSAATARVQAPVTGAPVIADTTPTEGSVLTINTASIADGNGLGVFAYQWQSSANGTTWTNIAGATAATFTPQDLAGITAGAQAGQFLRIAVSFTDGAGVRETVVSSATSVTGRNWEAADNNTSAFSGTAGDDIALGRAGANALTGNAGDDTLIGAGGNDVLTGGDGNDALGSAANEAGNDTLIGGAGNDVINGGAGTDIASYVTAMTAASFSNTGTSIVVNAGTEGVDTVSLVETLRFNNVAYTVASGTAANNTLTGAAGSQILFGFEGVDTINGGAGNDVIVAGDGNDFIVQAAATGNRDIVDGGAGTDTFTLTGNATSETFRIYTRTEALASGMTGLHANTEIVVTRNGTTNASIIAELDNVEEIVINATNTTANDANGVVNSGTFAGDTIAVFGDFRQTSLDYSTITIGGSRANDTIDISGLTSDHRVVFTSNGGTDTILGQVRAQDVFNGQGINDQRAGATAPVATVSETSVASSQLRAFGSSDGLDALLAGQSRHALREMVAEDTAPNRSGQHRMEAGAFDEQYLTELRLQPDRSSSSHDFGRTMVENADHDVRPLDLAQLVNPATAPDVRSNDVEFDTRHVGLSQYDLLLS
jgi:Ca2+-binding RTX toxin-like protein